MSDYTTRLKHYVKFELVELPGLKNTKNMSEKDQKTKEGELIMNQINSGDHVVLLDENGKQLSSVTFAEYLQKRMNSGTRNLVFVVGGPYGFDKGIYDRGDFELSLSSMTFSHQMIRLFFVEQVYRAFSILRNEPYHHR